MRSKLRLRPLLLACLLPVIAGGLAGATRPAPIGPQPNHAWKEVTLVYLSDVKGKIEPCG